MFDRSRETRDLQKLLCRIENEACACDSGHGASDSECLIRVFPSEAAATIEGRTEVR